MRTGGPAWGGGPPGPPPRRLVDARGGLTGRQEAAAVEGEVSSVLAATGKAPFHLQPDATSCHLCLPADAAPPEPHSLAAIQLLLGPRRLPEQAPPVRGLVSGDGGPQAGRLGDGRNGCAHGRDRLMRCTPVCA